MNKFFKKLAVLLSFVMVFTAMPMSVFAEEAVVAKIGDTPYTNLNTAFNEVQDGETIYVLGDITFDATTVGSNDGTYVDGVSYIGDKSFTVDFGGFTVTDDGIVNDYLIYVNNKGAKANEITFQNGTLISKNGCWATVCVNGSSSTNKTTLNLNNMKITNSNGVNYQGNQAVRARNGATVNVNNATVITSNGASYAVTGSTSDSIVNINNGSKCVQQNSQNAGGNHTCAAVAGKGVVSIYEGAEITSDHCGVHTLTTGTPVIDIYGGKIQGNNCALTSSTNGGTGELATVNVHNGEIIGNLVEYSSNGHIVVKGGNFTVDPTPYVAPTSFVTKVGENWVVEAADANAVSSEAELKAVLETDATSIKFDSNIDLSTAVVITKDVTVDLAGKTITLTEDTVGDGAFHVTGGTLTINDSVGGAVINGVGKNNYSMALWADGGHIVINAGKYTNVGAGSDDHYDLIYAKNGGTVKIYGGTFEAHTPKWTLNQHDSTNGKITVYGGTFAGVNPAKVYTEPTQPMSFVAEGYETKADGANYIVGEHKVEAVEGVAAKCEATGTKAYYTCKFCGTLYSDAEGKNVVAAESLVIPATGHAFGEWVVDEAAGVKTRTCKNGCGETETAKLPVTEEAEKLPNNVQTEVKLPDVVEEDTPVEVETVVQVSKDEETKEEATEALEVTAATVVSTIVEATNTSKTTEEVVKELKLEEDTDAANTAEEFVEFVQDNATNEEGGVLLTITKEPVVEKMENVPEADKAKITVAEGAAVEYLDIKIKITATANGESVTALVSELDKPMPITFAYPADWNEGVKEGMVRKFILKFVHDGVAGEVEAKDNGNNTVTAYVDQFSTYALTYVDVPATHNHVWGYNTTFDAAAHWDYCHVCGAQNTPVAHSDADGNGFCDCGWNFAATTNRANPNTGVTADMLK